MIVEGGGGVRSQPVDQRFVGRLLAGERLLWTGQPVRQRLYRGRVDRATVVFTLVWCAGSGFFCLQSLRGGSLGPAFVTGLFVLMGLYPLFGWALHDEHLRTWMTYALTDRRVLFLKGRSQPTLTALELDSLGEVAVTRTADGKFGTIRFGPEKLLVGEGNVEYLPSQASETHYFAIEEPDRVLELVYRARDALRREAGSGLAEDHPASLNSSGR